MPAARPGTTTYGRRLRQAREAKGLLQADLGAVLGLEDPNSAAPRISRYERGERMPDEKTQAALAKALGLPVAYFHAASDPMAEAILLLAKLPLKEQEAVVAQIRRMTLKPK